MFALQMFWLVFTLLVATCANAAPLKFAPRAQGNSPSTSVAASAVSTASAAASSASGTTKDKSGFVHPGVFVSQAQLDAVKQKVDAGDKIWVNAFNAMKDSEFGKSSREPTPRSSVDCGSASKNPSNGCWEERGDAIAAYANALAFSITEDEKYAKKSIEFMDAWAKELKTHTASNAPLQTGWSAASWARAGEIIKHVYGKWADEDVKRFQTMLREVYLPDLIKGDGRAGNWDLVMLEAAIGISVFLDDKDSYDQAMERFKGRVPAYIYLTKDGKTPKAAPGSAQDEDPSKLTGFWYNQKTFKEDGIAQETCRDFVHTGYGLSSIGHVAETALIQGENLYDGDVGERLAAALEFHSQFQEGVDKFDWLCTESEFKPKMEAVTEVGLNAFTHLGKSLPKTKSYTERSRPAGSNGLFIAFETLTHADNVATFKAFAQ